MGRFLQRDPIGYYDSMNLFQYVRNSPLNWIDPFGLSKATVIEKGEYIFIKYVGDTYHGGPHWHVLARKGGKLLGRVSMSGKVLTGSVPKSALKLLAGVGGISKGVGSLLKEGAGGAVIGAGFMLDTLATEVAAGTIAEWAIAQYENGKITYEELIEILKEQGIIEDDEQDGSNVCPAQ
jgi:hypothetical protein